MNGKKKKGREKYHTFEYALNFEKEQRRILPLFRQKKKKHILFEFKGKLIGFDYLLRKLAILSLNGNASHKIS